MQIKLSQNNQNLQIKLGAHVKEAYVSQQNCTQSDGTKGNWVVKQHDSGKVLSCHKTKEDAKSALQAMNAN